MDSTDHSQDQLAEGIHSFSISLPLPAGFSAGSQQPGSPGWPQQLFAVTIFLALFLRKSRSFL